MKITDYKIDSANNTPWRLFVPEGANKEYGVLWIQGWTSSMESHRDGVERMAAISGIAFATLDHAGHGLSSIALSDSTRSQQLSEVTDIYDELKKLGYKNIIAIGGSFGGYMAALLTGERDIHTAVLRAPAMYDDNELEVLHINTRKWQNPDRDQQDKINDPYIHENKAVRAIKNFNGSVFVFEHELDEQVPRIMPQTYFSNAKRGNYLVVPNTMHSPKLAENPQPHFDYIEHLVITTIKAAQLEDHLR